MSGVGGRAVWCRVLARLVVALLCTTFAMSALAEPSAAEKATARGLVRDGRNKLKSGDVDGALTDFRAAHEIMNVPTTGLEVGKAESEAGMLVEALDTLLSIVRTKAAKREARAFGRARAEAKELAKELALRVPSVRVKLTGDAATGATVTIDGEEVPPEAVGAAYKVNPGVHDVVATRGELEERARIELAEGEAREVVLHLTTPAETPPALAPPTHPMVWAGLAVAGAATVAGSITGALALEKHAEVAQSCPGGQCPPETHDDLDAGLTLGTASTVLFALAGAGAVATVVGLFLPYEDVEQDDPPESGVWLHFGPTGIALGGSM